MVSYTASISLDGFTVGPDQSVENPIGVGGKLLHGWLMELSVWREAHGGLEGGVESPSTEVVKGAEAQLGAYVMGRNMFGGGPGLGATSRGTAGGATIRRSICPSSSLLISRVLRSSAKEGQRSPSSPTASSRRCGTQAKRRETATWRSPAARLWPVRLSQQGLSTSSGSTIVPVLLGGGVRLFDDGTRRSTSSRSRSSKVAE